MTASLKHVSGVTALALGLALGSVPPPAGARESAANSGTAAGEVTLSVAGGVRYESALAVEELDTVARREDAASVARVKLGYQRGMSAAHRFKAAYYFEQRQFTEQSDYDLAVHYGVLDYSRKLGGVRAGAKLDTIYASLDDRHLLDNHEFSVYLSRLTLRRLYLRGVLGYQETDFARVSERASDAARLSGDAYYFLNGIQEYLNAGYRFEQKDASLDRLDYRAHRLELGYVRRVALGQRRPVRLKVDWRYEHRDYQAVTPSLATEREDRRQRWRIGLDAPVTRSLSLQLKYEHRDYSSNLPLIDFNDNRVEFMLEWVLL